MDPAAHGVLRDAAELAVVVTTSAVTSAVSFVARVGFGLASAVVSCVMSWMFSLFMLFAGATVMFAFIFHGPAGAAVWFVMLAFVLFVCAVSWKFARRAAVASARLVADIVPRYANSMPRGGWMAVLLTSAGVLWYGVQPIHVAATVAAALMCATCAARLAGY